MKLKFITTIIVAAFSINCFAQEKNEPIIAKFSHVVSPNSPKGLAADYFKQRVETLTKGKIIVKVYPNSALYKDKEEMDALKSNSVQFIAPSSSKFTPMGVKEYELFDLPYMFTDTDAVHKITQGNLGKKLLSTIEPLGFVGLGFWDNGMKQFSDQKPLTSIADFQGRKYRIQSSKVIESQFKTLGAKGVVLPFNEVYPALYDGIVDGTENPVSNFYTMKFYDVQKYVTMTNHGYLGYILTTNKTFWNSLTPELRDSLMQASVEATVYANKVAADKNQKDLSELMKTDTKVIELTEAQKKVFKNTLQIPVMKDNYQRIGLDLIQQVNKEVGNKEAYDALSSMK